MYVYINQTPYSSSGKPPGGIHHWRKDSGVRDNNQTLE